MRTLKKSTQFELISIKNNNNSDLPKDLGKDESCLKKLRANHPKNIPIGHLNIISLRNKFVCLKEIDYYKYVLGLYKTPSLRSEIFISEVTKALIFYSEKYDNILLMGDFNMIPENHHLKDFTDSNYFENVLKEPTYFKCTSPIIIDFFLANRNSCFMKSSTNETGISDHHKLIFIFLKSTCPKNLNFFTIDPLKTLAKNY